MALTYRRIGRKYKVSVFCHLATESYNRLVTDGERTSVVKEFSTPLKGPLIQKTYE